MKTVIEPLGNRVLVRVLEMETTTPGGILLPETAKDKPQEGVVEAVGDAEEMMTDLQVGDRIIFAKYSGTEIRLDGEEYLILNEDDVLARVREE